MLGDTSWIEQVRIGGIEHKIYVEEWIDSNAIPIIKITRVAQYGFTVEASYTNRGLRIDDTLLARNRILINSRIPRMLVISGDSILRRNMWLVGDSILIVANRNLIRNNYPTVSAWVYSTTFSLEDGYEMTFAGTAGGGYCSYCDIMAFDPQLGELYFLGYPSIDVLLQTGLSKLFFWKSSIFTGDTRISEFDGMLDSIPLDSYAVATFEDHQTSNSSSINVQDSLLRELIRKHRR